MRHAWWESDTHPLRCLRASKTVLFRDCPVTVLLTVSPSEMGCGSTYCCPAPHPRPGVPGSTYLDLRKLLLWSRELLANPALGLQLFHCPVRVFGLLLASAGVFPPLAQLLLKLLNQGDTARHTSTPTCRSRRGPRDQDQTSSSCSLRCPQGCVLRTVPV